MSDMAEVVIYTRDFCYYSDAARELLARKGAAFREINATGNRALRPLYGRSYGVNNPCEYQHIDLRGARAQ